ncbi:helix-turn-helix transcriptional regulator [Amycolatopsis sp. NPDC004378]
MAATTSSTSAQRTRFFTTDPDEALDFIENVYTARPPKCAPLDRTSPMAFAQVSAGEMSFIDFTMPPDLTLSLSGTDDLSVTTLIAGATHAELGKDVERYLPGDVCLGSYPQGSYQVACHGLRVHTLTIPAAALADSAGTQPGRPLRYETLAPRSPAAARQWKRVARFARDLLDDDETTSSPLILGAAARLLAATALSVFPNLAYPDRNSSTGIAPSTLRRAEEYIHAHAHTDIGLSDIAVACHVSARAVQYAFARHHDLTPLQYLRHVRLTRAHHDLLAADPSHGDTVTAIAVRWGFPHPGRFASAYQQVYGRSPSRTLHD